VNQDGSSPSRLISPLSKRVSLSQQIRSPELTSKNGSPRITPQQRKSPHRRGSSGSKSSNESPSRILVSPRKGWPQKIKVPRARPPYLSRGSASSRRGGAPTHMDSHSEEVWFLVAECSSSHQINFGCSSSILLVIQQSSTRSGLAGQLSAFFDGGYLLGRAKFRSCLTKMTAELEKINRNGTCG